MGDKLEPLASEMYQDLKDTNRFLRTLLISSFIVIGVLVAALAGTNLYHIYKWSQFDTIVVDSDQGPANYVQGDNTGGIFNGANSGASAQEREGQIPGNQNQS